MPSARLTFRRGLIATVIVLAILALLPQRYSGYGPVVRSVSMLGLSPLTRPLNSFSSALRRQQERPVLGTEQELSEIVLELQGRVFAMEQRERELERAVAELQGLRLRQGDSYIHRRAAVIGRSSDGSSATLQLNIGSRHGIRVGMPAVRGASVIGRVTQVGPTSSTLGLLTSSGTLLEVVAVAEAAESDLALPPERRRRLLLTPAGRNVLLAEQVDRELPVEVGDFARLMDDDWPRSVQGMLIGRVVAVEPDPDDPLLQRVGVRPLVTLRDVESVIVIVPREMTEEATPELRESGGGGGR